MDKPKKEEVEAMRETLKVFGSKSETYYDKLSDAQVEAEYNRHWTGVV